MYIKVTGIKKVSFQHVKIMLRQMDANYPFVMPNWLLVIMTVLGTTVLVKIVCMIWYFNIVKLHAR